MGMCVFWITVKHCFPGKSTAVHISYVFMWSVGQTRKNVLWFGTAKHTFNVCSKNYACIVQNKVYLPDVFICTTHVSNRRCFFTTRVVFLQQAFFVNIACCDPTSVVFSETTIFVDFREIFLIFLVFLQQALFFYNNIKCQRASKVCTRSY
jgi:hypothetical protein